MTGEMTTVRDGLGFQTTRRNETHGEAQGARVQAMIQARFVVAMQRPRDLDEVRLALLKECKRPNFAAVARWERQQGTEKISGWSIRFVESAVRCMRHLECQTETLYDSSDKRMNLPRFGGHPARDTLPVSTIDATTQFTPRFIQEGRRTSPDGTRLQDC